MLQYKNLMFIYNRKKDGLRILIAEKQNIKFMEEKRREEKRREEKRREEERREEKRREEKRREERTEQNKTEQKSRKMAKRSDVEWKQEKLEKKSELERINYSCCFCKNRRSRTGSSGCAEQLRHCFWRHFCSRNTPLVTSRVACPYVISCH